MGKRKIAAAVVGTSVLLLSLYFGAFPFLTSGPSAPKITSIQQSDNKTITTSESGAGRESSSMLTISCVSNPAEDSGSCIFSPAVKGASFPVYSVVTFSDTLEALSCFQEPGMSSCTWSGLNLAHGSTAQIVVYFENGTSEELPVKIG